LERDDEPEECQPLILVSPPSEIGIPETDRKEGAASESWIKKRLTGLIDNSLCALANWRDQVLIRPRAVFEMQSYVEEMMGIVNQMLETSRKEYQSSLYFMSLPNVHQEERFLMFSFLVHELRTPLFNISELLQSFPGQEEEDEFCRDLETCYKRIQRLIRQLPESQDDTSHSLKLDITPFSLQLLCKDIEVQVAYFAKTKNVQVKFIIPDDFQAVVKGDKYKIEQIAVNFLSNAIKYSPPNGVVSFAVEISERKKGSLIFKFSVIDQGPGISKSDQLQLFRPFSQVGIRAQTQMQTSGIGLSFCKQLAIILNNTQEDIIGLQSEPGKGACFWFKAHLTKMEALVHYPGSPRPSLSEQFKNKSLKILVAEDDKLTQKIIRPLFSRAGCADLEIASNGREAVDKLLSYEYDIVFLDMQMPELYGWQVAKKIKEQVSRKIPHIVILSGEGIPEVVEILSKEGIEKDIVVLEKPIRYNTLVDTVNNFF